MLHFTLLLLPTDSRKVLHKLKICFFFHTSVVSEKPKQINYSIIHISSLKQTTKIETSKKKNLPFLVQMHFFLVSFGVLNEWGYVAVHKSRLIF